MTLQLWEILVPTIKPDNIGGKKRYFTKKYHREWDKKILSITKGLTILQPNKGQWVSPVGVLFTERMIPVRIACNETQIAQIMNLTAEHYQQLAIFAYKVSNEVVIKEYKHE